MSTSVEHAHEHEHGLAPHTKATRARAGVLMLILSDALAVLATFAAGGYLKVLNTEGAYTIAGDFAPVFWLGLVVSIGLVVSGLLYYLWERSVRTPGASGQTWAFVVSWLLILAGGVVDVWIGNGLRYGTPISAYESMELLIVWSTGIHLLLTAFIGILLFGRIANGRLRIDNLPFVPEVVGYWWYYTAGAGVLLWLYGLLIH